MTKISQKTPPSPAQKAALTLIRGYQVFLSPLVGNGCRFSPTCSDYAAQAIMTYGVLKGGGLALRRIARCHPWSGPGGIDPVP